MNNLFLFEYMKLYVRYWPTDGTYEVFDTLVGSTLGYFKCDEGPGWIFVAGHGVMIIDELSSLAAFQEDLNSTLEERSVQVEVNEYNIVKYGLVQLTGNSAEDMLKQAAEAKRNGYTLACQIPDTDEVLEQNIFEAAGSVPSEMTGMDDDKGAVIEGGRIDDIGEEHPAEGGHVN